MSERKIIRHSLSEQAEILIREKILSLEYEPGERLVVDKLADDLEVSRTPVREALRNLAQQGLVNYDGKIYSLFFPISGDIEEIFTIRKALEPVAAELAVNRIAPEAIDELRLLLDQHTSREDDISLTEVDVHFHDVIVESAGNQRMKQILANMRYQFRLIRGWVAKRNRLEISGKANVLEIDTINEHRKIFDSLIAHDPESAAAAMAEHLAKGRRRVLHNLFETDSLKGQL